MRELKFRAWDTAGNQWLWITGFETAETSKSDGYTLDGIFHNGDYVGKEGIVLMQYTGLKDKNGKEIYEGDIVLVENHKQPAIVEYDEGCFYTHIGISRYRLGWWQIDAIEVIGNIYDNPELLKGEENA